MAQCTETQIKKSTPNESLGRDLQCRHNAILHQVAPSWRNFGHNVLMSVKLFSCIPSVLLVLATYRSTIVLHNRKTGCMISKKFHICTLG